MATTTDGRMIDVVRDEPRHRYLATIEGLVIGEAEFVLTPGLMVFTHTRIDPSLEGQGVGSVLVRWALQDARDRGCAVRASCPFVRSFLERHAEQYADLVDRPPGRAAPGGPGSDHDSTVR